MKDTKIYIFNSASRAALYGIGTYINQLTSCLKKDYLNIEVIYLHGDGKEVAVSEEKNYRQISIPNVTYRSAREADYYYRNITYLLEEYISSNKKEEYIFHLNFMSNPRFVSYLKKRYKCKIVLVSHYTNWSFSLFGNEKKLLSIANKKPRERSPEEKQILKGLESDIKMIKKCDRFVCVAQHTLDTLLKISDIDISKCRIINNALKDEYKNIGREKKQTLRAKWWMPLNTKIILFVGRLDEVKGVAFLIKAFKKLLQTNSDTHLIVAGDGDYSRWLKEAGNCWTKITFTGRLGKKKIFELYQIADVGVVTSLHEEFGYVAIEMMMHRLPIVTTDTGGLSEIIEDNISGLKVPVQIKEGKRIIDTNKLANKISVLLYDTDLAERIAKNGRARYLEKYELSVLKKNMLNLYNTI